MAPLAIVLIAPAWGLSSRPTDFLAEIQRHPNFSETHHTKNGFQNLEPSDPPAFTKTFPWILKRILFSERRHSGLTVRPIPTEELQESLRSISTGQIEGRARYWWLGHATVLVHTASGAFLTDPNFSQRASPVSFAGPERLISPAISIIDLGRVDYVLISHNHYDHLDMASILELRRLYDPVFFVPLGVAALLRSSGVEKIVELDWWEYVNLNGVGFHCTPSRHFSSRTLFDRNETLWASWYVEDRRSGFRFYFAGDTGYGSHFAAIRQLLGPPDLAMIPIGAYDPRWLMEPVHVDPEQAVQAFLDLGALRMLPIHWGTFLLADEPLDEPPVRMLAKASQLGLTVSRFDQIPEGGLVEVRIVPHVNVATQSGVSKPPDIPPGPVIPVGSRAVPSR